MDTVIVSYLAEEVSCNCSGEFLNVFLILNFMTSRQVSTECVI